MKLIFIALSVCASSLPMSVSAQNAPIYPQWWLDYDVVDAEDFPAPPGPEDTYGMFSQEEWEAWRAANKAPANLGQLKHIASQAKAYIDDIFSPSEAEWDDVYAPYLNPFPMVAGEHDYAPVNQGQAKFVVNGIYNLLLSYGVDTNSQLSANLASGQNWSYDKPWSDDGIDDANYAPLNLGQLKWMFSFDLSSFHLDTDSDGLPDYWEVSYGLDPNDANGVNGAFGDFDDDGATNLYEYVHGTSPIDPSDIPANSPTVVSVSSPTDGDAFLTGELISVSVSVVDADTDIESISMRWNGDITSTFELVVGGDYDVETHAPLISGSDDIHYTFELLARDIYGHEVVSSPLEIIILADSDNDLMPDRWELDIAYFGDLDEDASGDYDDDGAFNLYEYQQGTNPNDSSEVPDNTPATVSVVAPGNNHSVTIGDAIVFVAEASDVDTGVYGVEFFQGEVLLGEGMQQYDGSYQLRWVVDMPGSATAYPIIARVYDDYGHPTDSAPIDLFVKGDDDGNGIRDDIDAIWANILAADPDYIDLTYADYYDPEGIIGGAPINPALLPVEPINAEQSLSVLWDYDGDGISNYQEYLDGTDPNDFFNGEVPVLSIFDGNNQSAAPESWLERMIYVKVQHSSGEGYANAPVRFAVVGGYPGLGLSQSSNALSSSLVQQTASYGAKAYFYTPSLLTGTLNTTVTASLPSGQSVSFVVSTDAGYAIPPDEPYDFHRKVNYGPEGTIVSVTYQWRSNASSDTLVSIEEQQGDGSWANILPVGMTYASLDAPSDGNLYSITLASGFSGATTNTQATNTSSGGVGTSSSNQTNPAYVDSDGDGISDHDEIYIWGTSPDNADTDGDGKPDGKDAVGYDPFFTFDAVAGSGYAVIDVVSLSNAPDTFEAVNNRGSVVFSEKYNSFFKVYKLGGGVLNKSGRFIDMNNNDVVLFDPPEQGEHATELSILSGNGNVGTISPPERYVPYLNSPSTSSVEYEEETWDLVRGVQSLKGKESYVIGLAISDSGQAWMEAKNYGWTQRLWFEILGYSDPESSTYNSYIKYERSYGVEYLIFGNKVIGGESSYAKIDDGNWNMENGGSVVFEPTYDKVKRSLDAGGLDDPIWRLFDSTHDGDWVLRKMGDSNKFKFSDGTKLSAQGNFHFYSMGTLNGQSGLWKSAHGGGGPVLFLSDVGNGGQILSRNGGDAQQVVGFGSNGVMQVNGNRLWRNGRTLNDADILGPNNPDWSNLSIEDISDNGAFIAATATSATDGQEHLVLLVSINVQWESQYEDNPVEDFKVPAYYSEYSSKDLSWLEGKRYFPGAASPSEDSYRNRINVHVSIPEYANGRVKLRAFDVDDPTPIEGVDDDSGASIGDDNNEIDFSLSGEFSGIVTVGTKESISLAEDSITLQLNESGEAVAEFILSPQPGNNYRIAAELLLDGVTSNIGSLQVAEENDFYVSGNSEQVPALPLGIVSDTLTVWRKLYLEIDSMEAGPPSSGSENNVVTGTIADYSADIPIPGRSTLTLDISLPDEQDRFQFGLIDIDNIGIYEVQSNTDNILTNDEVVVKGNPGSSAVGQPFALVDDDDFYLVEAGLPPALPQNQNSASIVEAIMPKYAMAFIEVIDANSLGLNPNQVIPFKLNEAVILPAGTGSDFDDAKDIQDSMYFWAHTLVFGYQAPTGATSISLLDGELVIIVGGDRDPNEEPFLMGGTPEGNLAINNSYGYSVVYMEAIREEEIGSPLSTGILNDPQSMAGYRERYMGRLYGTSAHEIGHEPGLESESSDHSEGGLMRAGGARIDVDFSPLSIKRFREAQQWSD
ncbi:hypothetical protein H5P28_17810 [Ruficoccus amylovorans]|uniref:Uncharacterized protein n=1 Tax=Ruficoccus amylovorans TaxID=1804625 RepID=A0A842HJI7_9BACT|nr:thrombospondin type 3 repeat-containing protein [Ruficoccus amylovorans]MBC2596128.1 hypothetical protein [Ruficoccus amylovorans]